MQQVVEYLLDLGFFASEFFVTFLDHDHALNGLFEPVSRRMEFASFALDLLLVPSALSVA